MISLYQLRLLNREIMENCRECENRMGIEAKEEAMEVKRNNTESWFWLIERVKTGPVSDIICLIPKIRHFDLFGNLFVIRPLKKFRQDYLILFKMILKYQNEYHYEDEHFSLGGYLAQSIKAGRVEMVKFLVTEIRRPRKYCSAHLDLPKYIKLAEIFPVNKEILEYLIFDLNNLKIMKTTLKT